MVKPISVNWEQNQVEESLGNLDLFILRMTLVYFDIESEHLQNQNEEKKNIIEKKLEQHLA